MTAGSVLLLASYKRILEDLIEAAKDTVEPACPTGYNPALSHGLAANKDSATSAKKKWEGNCMNNKKNQMSTSKMMKTRFLIAVLSSLLVI